MLGNFWNLFSRFASRRQSLITRPDVQSSPESPQRLHAFGLHEFLNIQMPPREMLLDPILPERSLAMLYAPRGIGKSWLSWPAPGFKDTELGVSMEPEVGHGETEVYPRV